MILSACEIIFIPPFIFSSYKEYTLKKENIKEVLILNSSEKLTTKTIIFYYFYIALAYFLIFQE